MFQKSFTGLAVIASSMLVATAQLTPLPPPLNPENIIFPAPLVQLQTIDVKISDSLMEQIRLLDRIDQPFGQGECVVEGPDGTNQGLGLGELDLEFGGYRDFTLPRGNKFDNACCVFYLVTANTPFPEAFVAISIPFTLFKSDPGANFTNACRISTPVSSSSTSGPTTLPTDSSTYISTPPTTTAQSYTTSTIYSTSVETITKCPETVTHCPKDYVSYVTSTIAVQTTVCPVAPTHTPYQPTTYVSTIYASTIVTITECPKTVYNCPAHYSTVTTSYYPVSTTTVIVVPAYTTTVSPLYSYSTLTIEGTVYTSTYQTGYTTYQVPATTTVVPYYPSQILTKTAGAVEVKPTYTTAAALQFTGAANPAKKLVGGGAAGLGAAIGLFLAM